MDRNQVIGFSLIAAILIGYTYFTAPSQEEVAEQKRLQDSIAQVEAVKDSITTVQAASTLPEEQAAIVKGDTVIDSLRWAAQNLLLEEKFGKWASSAKGEEQQFWVENEKFKIRFSNKGAQVKEVILKDFETYRGKELSMFDPSSAVQNLTWKEGDKNIQSSDLFFSTDVTSDFSVSGDQQKTISFKAGDLVIKYSITGNSYGIDYDISRNNSIADDLKLAWGNKAFTNEKHAPTERQKCSVFFREFDENRDYLSETSAEDEESELEKNLNWVAFKQNFFSSIIIAPEGIEAKETLLRVVSMEEEDTVHTKAYLASLNLGKDNDLHYTLFYGPNDYPILKDFQVEELDRIIDFGWGIFGWVNKYLILNIFKFLDQFNLSYGLIILILTILIKLALSPLTYKNFVSSAKMRVLKPEIDAMNKKNKDADAMKKQQDTMALYKQTGVNPMAGCLPMLLQMPILYAMFRFFPASLELRQESFLWADDLSSYDSIMSLPFDIPFYGDHVSLFTILMCLSTLLYTHMNSSQMNMPQQEGMPNMKVMMYIFPFMMLFFFNNYSSGLSYYYLLANLMSIAQMWIIKKFIIDEGKILAQIEENKKKKAGKSGKSRFQRKLEDMAKKKGYNLPKN